MLDAGALVALERNDRPMWARLKVAAASNVEVLVPSTVLAQVWRNAPSQARLAHALAYCRIAPFDAVARTVGELCGASSTADICDAHVAVVAGTSGDVLCTSDVSDLTRLLAAFGKRRPTLVRC